jgi:hypothetical protein
VNLRIPALILSLCAGCTEPPEAVSQAVATALNERDFETALRHVHANYADPRGGRDALEQDFHDLRGAFDRMRVRFEDTSTARGAPGQATITGRLDAELVGQTTWRVVGPLQLEMTKDQGFRIESGLLPHFRGIRSLMRRRHDALEANDAEALRPLLHPNYRDGDQDAEQVIQRLSSDLEGVRIRVAVTNYRLEVRGPIAHLDEHYLLTVGARTLPPQIARFTLERSAGRWRIRAGLYPPSPKETPIPGTP